MSAPHGQRAELWLRMRAAGSFTANELVNAGFARATVIRYITALHRAGYLAIAYRPSGHVALVYHVVRDVGPQAPTVDKTEQVSAPHPSARHRAWQAARVLRRFSSADLQMTAEITHQVACKYLYCLRAAGYVREVSPARPGQPGGHAVYQLIKNPGPMPLRGRRFGTTQTLYDPNTKEVFHP